MNRKEITESRAYQISKAALEHASRAKNVVEAYEAGAEWADENTKGLISVEAVEEWIRQCFEFLNEGGGHHFKIDKFVDNFRRCADNYEK